MMKPITILILFSLLTSILCAQELDSIVYFKKEYSSKPVTKEKAKFSKRFSTNDKDEKTTELMNLVEKRILWSRTWKNNEPVGIWYIQGIDTSYKVNYDFKLVYSDKTCTTEEVQVLKEGVFFNDSEEGYVAPVIAKNKYGNPITAIMLSTYYIDRDLQGKVTLSFTINKEGQIENVEVLKGVGTSLDKEAARVIREIKFSSPPKKNGEPISLCTTLTIPFIHN
jgi:TonB family protein